MKVWLLKRFKNIVAKKEIAHHEPQYDKMSSAGKALESI